MSAKKPATSKPAQEAESSDVEIIGEQKITENPEPFFSPNSPLPIVEQTRLPAIKDDAYWSHLTEKQKEVAEKYLSNLAPTIKAMDVVEVENRSDLECAELLDIGFPSHIPGRDWEEIVHGYWGKHYPQNYEKWKKEREGGEMANREMWAFAWFSAQEKEWDKDIRKRLSIRGDSPKPLPYRTKEGLNHTPYTFMMNHLAILIDYGFYYKDKYLIVRDFADFWVNGREAETLFDFWNSQEYFNNEFDIRTVDCRKDSKDEFSADRNGFKDSGEIIVAMDPETGHYCSIDQKTLRGGMFSDFEWGEKNFVENFTRVQIARRMPSQDIDGFVAMTPGSTNPDIIGHIAMALTYIRAYHSVYMNNAGPLNENEIDKVSKFRLACDLMQKKPLPFYKYVAPRSMDFLADFKREIVVLSSEEEGETTDEYRARMQKEKAAAEEQKKAVLPAPQNDDDDFPEDVPPPPLPPSVPLVENPFSWSGSAKPSPKKRAVPQKLLWSGAPIPQSVRYTMNVAPIEESPAVVPLLETPEPTLPKRRSKTVIAATPPPVAAEQQKPLYKPKDPKKALKW